MTDTIDIEVSKNRESDTSDGLVFENIQDALNYLNGIPDIPAVVTIHPGTYTERLLITRSRITFRSAEPLQTVISFGMTAPENARGIYLSGTWECATVTILAEDIEFRDICIENSFDFLTDAELPPDDPRKSANTQAVALMTGPGADRCSFFSCRIDGYQDTVLVDNGRSFFDSCSISGNIDFICGAGQAVFQDCRIISRPREEDKPLGYVCAPSTPAALPYGFLFIGCRLVAEEGVDEDSVCLGRPWHPGGNLQVSNSCLFRECYMESHIREEAYAPISTSDSAGNRTWFELQPDSRLFEFRNNGPGAKQSSHRPQLLEHAARWYTADHVLAGWTPQLERG